ncbi:hypothetical protein GPJ56_008274 [Histomonas meleagridis]|uniref:uncharacterized protein n=1 Tax=Histomonas meleagridis TaxID=135588 RepID=UPI00355A902B|nr:hypothetical protein GPJ56_008274 [Histomonas meleagridis]KAH0806843.1 hypothetical protein GO595_000019 [Histomonas meleagridis]
MNRTDSNGFPYVSFGKSVIQILQLFNEARGQSTGKYKCAIYYCFSDDNGKPAFRQTPGNRDYQNIKISPIGNFNDTVKEGLFSFNRIRYELLKRDTTDSFYQQKAKTPTFLVLFFSNFDTLDPSFYQETFINEYAFRPDEYILFFHICGQDQTSKIARKYHEAMSNLDIEIIPTTHAYHNYLTVVNQSPSRPPIFHFIIDNGYQLIKCSLSTQSSTYWPLPYDYHTDGSVFACNSIPLYKLQPASSHIDTKTLKFDGYYIKLSAPIEIGEYVLSFSNSPTSLFAILTVNDKHVAELKVLPYNFPELLDTLPTPARSDLDKYLGKLPLDYIGYVTKYFQECHFSYNEDFDKQKNIVKEQRAKEKVDLYKLHRQQISEYLLLPQLDHKKISTPTLSTIFSEIPKVHNYETLTPKRTFIKLNSDTFDDIGFVSLEMVRSKVKPPTIYSKISSSVTDEFLNSLLPKEEEEEKRVEIETKIERQIEAISDGLKVETDESDSISMLEDLLILLRERCINELEMNLRRLETNNELYDFIKQFLLKAIDRFQLESVLPEKFVEELKQ